MPFKFYFFIFLVRCFLSSITTPKSQTFKIGLVALLQLLPFQTRSARATRIR